MDVRDTHKIENGRTCAACDRNIIKAQKIYRGKSLCTACYARLFKHKPCTKCGKPTRAYIQEASPICGACERETRTCMRCDKPTPRAGLLVNGKAVCNSCAPYFRTPGICTRCGDSSSRLSRIKDVCDDPVCEKCRRDLIYATCKHCGKHRRIHSIGPDGSAFCKPCTEQPLVSHTCPDCGNDVPGAGAAACHPCSHRRTLRRKSKILGLQFRNVHLQKIWREFTEWLIVGGKTSVVLAALQRYAEPLVKIDHHVNESDKINNQHLSIALTAEDLRKAGLLAEYLTEIGVLKSGSAERATWSDKKRIRTAIAEVKGAAFLSDIEAYVTHLETNKTTLTARTMRMYVRAAVELMKFARVDSAGKLTGEILNAFIRKCPGYRASLSAWLRFLNERRGICLTLNAKKNGKPVSTNATIDTVAALLKAMEAEHSTRAQLAYLAKLLSVLYSIPLESILRIKKLDVVSQNERVLLALPGHQIELDKRIEKWVRLLLVENNSTTSGYLFCGRLSGDAWSITGVAYYLRKLNIGK